MNGFNTQLINPISRAVNIMIIMNTKSEPSPIVPIVSSSSTKRKNGSIAIAPVDKTLTSRFHFNSR